MDGGLADNIGLRAVADEYRRGFIRERINGNKIEKLVFIVVNAKTEPHENLDTRESPPDLSAVAYKTATISMDNYTFDTVELVRELAEERMRTQRTLLQCQKAIDDRCPGKPPLPALAGSGLEIYVIEINFDAVKDERERDCFLNLPTTFSLPSQQATALVEVAGELLNAHPKFQKLLDDLGVKPGPVRSEARTAYCQNK